MRNITLLIFISFLFAGCAVTNFQIHQARGHDYGSERYYSPEIQIHNAGDIADNLYLHLLFEEVGCNEYWMICVHSSNSDSFHAKPALMFILDSEIEEYQDSFISPVNLSVSFTSQPKKPDYYHVFMVSRNLFQDIIFAEEVRLLITCDGKVFEGILDEQNKDEFGLFYNYVRHEVIENKSIFLKS
ncbi:MAG: hypothetical protein JXB60_10165 [Candidatus Cloacimonetes bacterium]|nr:hypothetical protein [Candidatus Cloacimonadota bacterium]